MDITTATAIQAADALRKKISGCKKQERYWEKQAKNSKSEFKNRALERARENTVHAEQALAEIEAALGINETEV